MTEQEKIKIIADRYGYEPQSRRCIEEMAEFTQAINKLWRKEHFGGNEEEITQARQNVEEEIADVFITVLQMVELLEISEEQLLAIINQKLDRQLKRIFQKDIPQHDCLNKRESGWIIDCVNEQKVIMNGTDYQEFSF